MKLGNKLGALLGGMSVLMGGMPPLSVTKSGIPEESTPGAAPIYTRNPSDNPGDGCWKNLQYKRIKGKWRVKK